ncbi:MAG: aminodeoxychorismate synthase component I [Sandaracinus sp.]|nr:aminodeoxychorismate synthase component I [Sandaracinus sp.]
MPAMDLEGAWGPARLRAAALGLRGHGGLAWLDADGSPPTGRRAFMGCAPVETRRVPWGQDAYAALDELSRGGEPGRPRWVGYLSYDAFWARSSLTPRMDRDTRWPTLLLHRYDALLEVDVPHERARLVGDDDAAIARLHARLVGGGTGGGGAVGAGGAAVGGETGTEGAALGSLTVGALTVTPRATHARAIERARDHIAAGEVYQVNLARAWTGELAGDPLALWLAMREASPVPLGLYLDGGDHQVLARTMERFLEWHPDAEGRGPIETRPIKGTIARAGADADEAARLRADPKEHAEHAMIVDLVRNDLGRVSETGSVEVTERFAVEPFAKLAHLVSTVRGTTRPGTTTSAVMDATFPPGSVTGAPKSAALAIIEALEPVPRGPYCGAVGFVDGAGGLSLAVAIRTAFVAAGTVRYHAGGGLVWASEAAREVAETELKARVFLDALAGANGPGADVVVEERD